MFGLKFPHYFWHWKSIVHNILMMCEGKTTLIDGLLCFFDYLAQSLGFMLSELLSDNKANHFIEK